mmetsp:Transcript_54922/g.130925  ORF Transcript_54922/g.130925 Transcript_54922/m.130925 type:complete len:610 (-) Transcript_54922:223-2052(-)
MFGRDVASEVQTWRNSLFPSCLLAGLCFIAGCLQGCKEDIFEQTCVWHNDVIVRGCPLYNFQQCIHGCTHCISAEGPDECAQLKCAAYCAKQEEGSCLANFRELCTIAVRENFPAAASDNDNRLFDDFPNGATCDVNCNAASKLAAPSAAALLLSLLGMSAWLAGPPGSRSLCIAFGLAIAVALQGCECTDPEPQLDWEPAKGDLERRADRWDENGLWRGNPTWAFSMELEIEDYQCKQMHLERDVCIAWTVHEWNCGEHDFGICKCHELHPVHDFCQRWGCHTLEADQQKCEPSGDDGNEKTCTHEQFPMTQEVYDYLMELANKVNSDQLTPWWHVDIAETSPGNFGQFPPDGAYLPSSRRHYFEWGGQCIINGDNAVRAYRRCKRWREVETEIQHCNCTEPASTGKACLRWHCEERDVGLFSILFRTEQPISTWADGVETEEYECKEFNQRGHCVVWEGHIESQEEVEVTRCHCDGDCHELGAVWRCDEYELPKTLHWNHPKYGYVALILVVIGEIILFPGLAFVGGAMCQDTLGLGLGIMCSDCCLATIVLPFLVVTVGFWGFMALGVPFWAVRCLACGAILCCTRKGRRVCEESTAQIIGKPFST